MSEITRRLHQALQPYHWKFASMLPLPARRHYLHTAATRRLGNFRTPTRFTEKVNWRIINDRRPIIAEMSDKLRAKEIARERVPGDELRIPQTYWSGTDLAEAPELSTLGPWVLKPNNGSGRVVFGPECLDAATLPDRIDGWVDSDQADVLGEWGYQFARPILILEERIPMPECGDLKDYKFFVFDGVPRVIQVNARRHTDSPRATFFDTDWNRFDVRWEAIAPDPDEPRPQNLAKMLDLASRLSDGMDMLRVDLYSVGDDVWFGEYTPYPCGGTSRYSPRSFDVEFGAKWTLPPLDAIRS